ncbi:unnamed protein product, partial [Mesorhabditis belari]|uniref:Uncharacterized protein n=1 Tax=Mesorhabditis belari TaxID=2138241 RepID=A0AAF3J8L4_9BILA
MSVMAVGLFIAILILFNAFQIQQKERSDELTKINSEISQSDDRSTKIGADLKEMDSKVAEMSKKMAKLEADLVEG